MDQETFDRLQFGNVIAAPGGVDKYIVTQVIRDSAGKALFVGFTQALDHEKAANGWELVNNSTVKTYLVGQTIPSTL